MKWPSNTIDVVNDAMSYSNQRLYDAGKIGGLRALAAQTAKDVFRNFSTPGDLKSGDHQPVKREFASTQIHWRVSR